MANSIAFKKNYASILDKVYQREATSACLNSDPTMVRAGRGAREIMVPRISVTGLGNYERNVGYKTGSINYEWETKTFNYDRGIRLFADAMDIEETGIEDAFVQAGGELQRVQVAPEADAFTFAQIAGHKDVASTTTDFSDAEAGDVLAALRSVTNEMDELQVSTGSRFLFITPTLKGILDDFSLANPARSNRVLTRFSRIVEVPQVRFYTKIDLLNGDDDKFGYAKAADGADLNFLVVEKSAVVKFDKHVPSRIFSPDELESLDSYMLKYRKYGIVELMDAKLDGIHASIAGTSAATPTVQSAPASAPVQTQAAASQTADASGAKAEAAKADAAKAEAAKSTAAKTTEASK